MTTPFTELPQRTQQTRLRPLAIQFAHEFGLKPQQFKLISYGYNATYKLTTPDQRVFALKLILDSPRELPNLKAEITWCNQLAQAGIPLARPHSTIVPNALLTGFPKPIYAQCFHWLPGRRFPKLPSHNQLRKVADLYRILHESPPTLTLGEYFPECRETLIGTECRISDSLILNTLDECNATFRKLWKNQPATAIHFDLHAQNIIYHQGVVQPFDFEFTHIAPPLIDIANLFFSFDYPKTTINLADAIWPSFKYRPSDFGLNDREFQSLIVARKILLLNDLYHSTNPSLKAKLPRALKTTALVVENFNKCNRYVCPQLN
ncbi:MAG: phosphotransferase [Fimbriimonadaceae bacterium]